MNDDSSVRFVLEKDVNNKDSHCLILTKHILGIRVNVYFLLNILSMEVNSLSVDRQVMDGKKLGELY